MPRSPRLGNTTRESLLAGGCLAVCLGLRRTRQMNTTAFAHAALIHVSNYDVDCFTHCFHTTLTITGDRVVALHDGVLTPILPGALGGRLD